VQQHHLVQKMQDTIKAKQSKLLSQQGGMASGGQVLTYLQTIYRRSGHASVDIAPGYPRRNLHEEVARGKGLKKSSIWKIYPVKQKIVNMKGFLLSCRSTGIDQLDE